MQTVFIPELFARSQLSHSDLDDMREYTAAQKWTLTGGGTFAVAGVGGLGTLTPGAGDNGQGYVQETNLPVLLAAGKPTYFKAFMKYAEAATNVANIFIGFDSAMATNHLVDNGGGMIVTGQHSVFYKIDGGTTWQVESRNGSGATTANVQTNDTGITAGGTAYHLFEINTVDQGVGTNYEVTYKIDGVTCLNPTTGRPIVHVLAYTSSVAMGRSFGVKNGSASLETMIVDFIGYAQTRTAS